MMGERELMIPKAFDFIKFAKLFYSDLTLASVEGYCLQYPALKPEAILFISERVSFLLFSYLNPRRIIKRFEDFVDRYYNAVYLMKQGELSHEEKQRLPESHYLLIELEKCLKGDELFLSQLLERGLSLFTNTSFTLKELEPLRDYVPFFRCIARDRAAVMLSYVYNYLKKHPDCQSLTHLPEPAPWLSIDETSNPQPIKENQKKSVTFLETPNIRHIPRIGKKPVHHRGVEPVIKEKLATKRKKIPAEGGEPSPPEKRAKLIP